MENNPSIIGEVIESSTTEFTAESKKLHSPPLFGCYVKVSHSSNDDVPPPPRDDEQAFDDPFADQSDSFGQQFNRAMGYNDIENQSTALASAVYAVVYNACTSPVNKGSRLRAYWKSEDELREEQPQLEEWHLLTEFKAVIIGYSDERGVIHQFIPPQPVKIHSPVELCSVDEVCAITERLYFLRTLANFNDAPVEEVIAACIREAYKAQQNNEFLVSAAKELALLMKYDYDRLQAIIRRISSI